ncbi:hypothetical protein H17ap60334_02136 [Thermosipho africanus H17ap60334]|nr:hypothetical protein H17ap60334_02136 [Thermosipho africanus H17ap60334]RDI90504.1 hypothetical protein Ob7_08499 [Thermosipho africanus Ob7]
MNMKENKRIFFLISLERIFWTKIRLYRYGDLFCIIMLVD